MNAVVIYESLTGKTQKAAEMIAAQLQAEGVATTVSPVTRVDLAALSAADLVIVGSWTDGFVFVGQRPGRASRLRKLPVMRGKKVVVFCTYAIDAGHTLEKLQEIMEAKGAQVVGGMQLRRDRLATAVPDFVDRTLAAIAPA